MTAIDFGQAYQSGFKKTVTFLIHQGIFNHVAEEVAQSAWARGWECLSQLRDENAIDWWIKKIALNHYRRHYHEQKRFGPMIDIVRTELPSTAALDVKSLLEQCPQEHQTLLTYYMQELTPEEIGKRLGATSGAVRIRLMRARRSARLGISQRIPRTAKYPGESHSCGSVPTHVYA